MAPVSGIVTMDDKPLAGAHVNFQPIGATGNQNPGPGSHAKTDENGRFTLRLAADGDHSEGAVLGKHRVTISGLEDEQVEVNDAGGLIVPVDPVPAQYNSETELSFIVRPGGTNKANFKLSSKSEK